MKESIVPLLACPLCQHDLTLSIIEVMQTGSDDTDVARGVLQCRQHAMHMYPVVNGIPRLLPAALDRWLPLLQDGLHRLPKYVRQDALRAAEDATASIGSPFQHAQDSFSSEWAEMGNVNSAWGQDVAERRRLFLQCLNLGEDALENKRILDAGCGNGMVEFGLLGTEAEVFAIDLSYSVDLIQQRLLTYPPQDVARIHLLQGNVHQLPFKAEVFDLVHSAGVLHHTPDTYQGFRSVSRPLKPGGKCFIEVYSNEHKNAAERCVHHLFNAVRRVTTRIPHRLLHSICYALAPILYLYIGTCNLLHKRDRYIPRTLHELELSLFDALSPLYDWHHSEKEVHRWYAAGGFECVIKTYFNHNVIGLVGEKAFKVPTAHAGSSLKCAS